jgi:uncharacterized protein YndB with AHSA1/START domain
MKLTILSFLLFMGANIAFAQPNERFIFEDVTIDAGVKDVWSAWSTDDGVRSFFAPASKIDLKVYGDYEIYFNPEGKAGERGAEGTKILAIQPEKMLTFTWNNPPILPGIRWDYTTVILRFKPVSEKQTRVTLYQVGWGEGEEWDKAYEYFNKAWSMIVLPRLQHRFKVGPIDWNNPPAIANGKAE